MTATHFPLSVARFFGGRSNRREFWLSVVLLLAGNFGLSLVLGPVLTSAVSLPVWIVIGSRRLHDFGQTGWWSLIPFVLGFAVGFARGAGLEVTAGAEMLFNFAVMIVTTLVIGLVPGTKGSNRFGAESGATPDVLSDTFG